MKPCPNPECGSWRVGCGSRVTISGVWVAYARCDACLMTGPIAAQEGPPSQDPDLRARYTEAIRLWDLLPREVQP